MKTTLFRSPEQFRNAQQGYRPLPFRFMRWSPDELFLSNDAGEYAFLSRHEFAAFVGGALPLGTPSYCDLKSKHFLTDSASTAALALLATKYRTKKSFLDGFTRLHMFVVTLRCDQSCSYCQVSRVTQDRMRFDMSREAAGKALDLVFRGPAEELKIEFQGGEPLLNFDLIRWIVERAHERSLAEKRRVEYVIATNLSPLTDDMLAWCAAHDVCLSTSLDGPAFIHNANRPRPGGNSYEITVTNLARAREALGPDRVAALMTTTELSLRHPREIVDEYVQRGFDSIFLRAISPYGFAAKSGIAFRYQAERFVEFYKTALAHIIELNRSGTPFLEVYAQILLQKILTPFPTGYVDLQSPAGTGISAVIYNYDGDVYASDEGRMLAEMGDTSFRLGNVLTDSYERIFGGEILRTLIDHSCLETLPGCSECAFAPYCGADPVRNWATQHDLVGHRPTSAFCTKNMAIIRHLIDLLRSGDTFTRGLLVSWATCQQPKTADGQAA